MAFSALPSYMYYKAPRPPRVHAATRNRFGKRRDLSTSPSCVARVTGDYVTDGTRGRRGEVYAARDWWTTTPRRRRRWRWFFFFFWRNPFSIVRRRRKTHLLPRARITQSRDFNEKHPGALKPLPIYFLSRDLCARRGKQIILSLMNHDQYRRRRTTDGRHRDFVTEWKPPVNSKQCPLVDGGPFKICQSDDTPAWP